MNSFIILSIIGILLIRTQSVKIKTIEFSNTVFPILKKLVVYNDPIAIRAFNREILKQFQTGTEETVTYLLYEGYHEFLDTDDTGRLLLTLKTQSYNITIKR